MKPFEVAGTRYICKEKKKKKKKQQNGTEEKEIRPYERERSTIIL